MTDITTDDVLAELADFFQDYEPQPGDFTSDDIRDKYPTLDKWRVRDKITKMVREGIIEEVGRIGSRKYYRKV